MLFQLVDAARSWVCDHPMNVQQTPSTNTMTKHSESPQVTVCKFFLQGKCRFGDKCRNSHRNTGTSAAHAKRMAVAGDDVIQETQASTGKGAKSKEKPLKEETGKKVPM